MILVYVSNRRIGEVADLGLGRVSYRNPKYWDGPEKCDQVYVHGDYPHIVEAYGDKVIGVPYKGNSSTDYTIAELRAMRSDFHDEQWEEFIKGDNRKSIGAI